MKLFAQCIITGNKAYPHLHGKAYFYNTSLSGTLIKIEVTGLPDINSANKSDFFGLHIHEYGDCSIPFDKTGNHYNPNNSPHPYHAGDLPPLLSNNGYAYSCIVTNRFKPEDIINKSLVIHSEPDDFRSQPSGNSGEKIGCGIIRSY